MMEILECGHPASEQGPIHGYGSKDGKRYCYDCCEQGDREAMRTEDTFSGAYVSSDGRTITNWPGRLLGRVTYLARRDGTRSQWGEYLYSVKVTDVFGQRWYGVGGGRGMWVTLRKYKNQAPLGV